jgi:hypothetical protein
MKVLTQSFIKRGSKNEKTSFFGVLLIITSSCATEKLNLSPLSNIFIVKQKVLILIKEPKKHRNQYQENVNASEISNLILLFHSLKTML